MYEYEWLHIVHMQTDLRYQYRARLVRATRHMYNGTQRRMA